MDGGDIFLIDPSDNGRTDRGGTIIWLHDEPDWTYDGVTYPVMQMVVHTWGESGKHVQILDDLMDWLIANGRGDLPVSYERSGHPLTKIADQLFITPDKISSDGRKVITTANQAKAQRQRGNGGGR